MLLLNGSSTLSFAMIILQSAQSQVNALTIFISEPSSIHGRLSSSSSSSSSNRRARGSTIRSASPNSRGRRRRMNFNESSEINRTSTVSKPPGPLPFIVKGPGGHISAAWKTTKSG